MRKPMMNFDPIHISLIGERDFNFPILQQAGCLFSIPFEVCIYHILLGGAFDMF